MSPPRLTDRHALARHRARAAARPEALYLHRLAADEIEERLTTVNRRFTRPAVVTPFPALWAGRLGDARIVPEAEVLDLAPGAHDLVIHALALHWADDPVGQVVQCRRALVPDGLFLGITFGGRTLAPLRAALAAAEAEVSGGLSPRVLPMADIRDLGAVLQRAGLALPVADAFVQEVRHADLAALMRDLRAMGEGNALADRHRRIPPRALFARAAALLAGMEGAGGGDCVITPFEFVVLTGWAPHESQQKPLRPGSAAARLADALGSTEETLPDRAQP
jgi:SAM-dependent methyltransferase